MTFSEILKALSELRMLHHVENFSLEGPDDSYNVRKDWFSRQIPNADRNGLYFYINRNGKILYAGRGLRKSGGGIGARASAHLGKAESGGQLMFPYHEWIHDGQVKAKDKATIAKGDFRIATVAVIPEDFIPLAEVYCQTLCQVAKPSEPPPLNKKIG